VRGRRRGEGTYERAGGGYVGGGGRGAGCEWRGVKSGVGGGRRVGG